MPLLPADQRAAVETAHAPAAIGPYSQAIRSGNLLFVSGQIGLDPATGRLVPGGVPAETEQALRNLAAILEAGGSSFERALKCTVYLLDMADFAAMNEVYGRVMPTPPPARATVAVRELPAGARVEIDVIAER